MVPHPAQRPFHRRPLFFRLLPDSIHIRRRFGQPQVAPAQRFHDHHPQIPGRGILQTFSSGLVFLIQKIILYLTEDPGIGIHDAFEVIQYAVKGKSGIDNAAVCIGLVQEIRYTE